MSRPRSYYDSGSLHIESYDSIYEPLPEALAGDIAFYADLARRGGGRVLEIGCGTGRVTLALAAAGFDMVGIDLSEEMLAQARAKRAALPAAAASRIDLVRADMRDFALGQNFATIILPFRTFHLLLSEADQRRCLAAIARHLGPGGHVAIHLFEASDDIVAHAGEPVLGRERGVNRLTGRRIEAYSGDCTVDAARQIRREIWHYREFDQSGTALREQRLELAVRWIRRPEMRALLEQAGFAVEAEYGDFHFRPPRAGGEQIWVAAKI
jgi:SAM-dependent methyltransferase